MSVGETDLQQVVRPAAFNVSHVHRHSLPFEDLRTQVWKTRLIAELNRSAVRKRLSIGLTGVACINPVTFIICQAV
jgi:hypothetical protein